MTKIHTPSFSLTDHNLISSVPLHLSAVSNRELMSLLLAKKKLMYICLRVLGLMPESLTGMWLNISELERTSPERELHMKGFHLAHRHRFRVSQVTRDALIFSSLLTSLMGTPWEVGLVRATLQKYVSHFFFSLREANDCCWVIKYTTETDLSLSCCFWLFCFRCAGLVFLCNTLQNPCWLNSSLYCISLSCFLSVIHKPGECEFSPIIEIIYKDTEQYLTQEKLLEVSKSDFCQWYFELGSLDKFLPK